MFKKIKKAIKYLFNIDDERLKQRALVIATAEGKTNECTIRHSGYIFYVDPLNDEAEIMGTYIGDYDF